MEEWGKAKWQSPKRGDRNSAVRILGLSHTTLKRAIPAVDPEIRRPSSKKDLRIPVALLAFPRCPYFATRISSGRLILRYV
jgi:hypothetical protein